MSQANEVETGHHLLTPGASPNRLSRIRPAIKQLTAVLLNTPTVVCSGEVVMVLVSKQDTTRSSSSSCGSILRRRNKRRQGYSAGSRDKKRSSSAHALYVFLTLLLHTFSQQNNSKLEYRGVGFEKSFCYLHRQHDQTLKVFSLL